MNPSVLRGAAVLRRMLQDQCFDVRQCDESGSWRWLERHLEHWERDLVFAQRAKIRDLRRSHPELRRWERKREGAAAADAATAAHARLRELAKGIGNAEKAIAGLTEAIGRAASDVEAEANTHALERKRDSFLVRRERWLAEQAELIRASHPRQDLLRIREQLQRLRTAIGLDEAEATLAALQRERGQRSGRAGRAFEDLANRVIESVIVPELAGASGLAGAGSLHVLRGVTLGAARIELDGVVVRQSTGAGRSLDPASEPVEVLAVVEAKRNINDLAHGFRHRQQNLAWLTGDTEGYDPREYRTRRFTSGHFDRPAVHRHQGREFLFTRRSFRTFHRDAATGWRLEGLYWVTRPGPIWGLSRASLHRVSYRVATDVRWAPDDPRYRASLWRWVRGLAEEIETPDVLRLYASTEPLARRILLIPHSTRD